MNNSKFNKSYHEKYLRRYGNYHKKEKNNYLKKFDKRKILITSLFIFVPIFFTFFIDFTTTVNKQNMSKSFLMTDGKNIHQNFYEIYENKKGKIDKIHFKYELFFINPNKKDIEIEKQLVKLKPKQNTLDLKNNDYDFKINSSHISEKKKNFIQMILPLAIHQNQIILVERERLLKIKDFLNLNKTIDKKENKFIKFLANKYKVKYKNKHKVDIIDELLLSVDVIPNSIVLAQAANESGWGSSRFAKEYNALFGEYTYNHEKGVVPYDREEGKKHLVKYFSSIDQSVISYFNNINSHYAYDQFRQLRKAQRNNNNSFDAFSLVGKLGFYAEDVDYIKTINSIIKTNNLLQFDNIKSITNL